MNDISKYVVDLLLNDGIRLFLREIKTNHISFFCSKRFSMKRILSNVPLSISSSHNCKTIKDIMLCEIDYFKRSGLMILGIDPRRKPNMKQQFTYCMYWFIRDIFGNLDEKDSNLILNSIIDKLIDDGKIY